MKKVIGKQEYDTEKCSEIVSAESVYCVKYNGNNFDYATLCITRTGHFFLHGKGPLGCNSIVPMSMIAATNWLKEALDHEKSKIFQTLADFLEKRHEDKSFIDVQIMSALCLL